MTHTPPTSSAAPTNGGPTRFLEAYPGLLARAY